MRGITCVSNTQFKQKKKENSNGFLAQTVIMSGKNEGREFVSAKSIFYLGNQSQCVARLNIPGHMELTI